MSALPWAKFYPSDWMCGTACLSIEERGAYISLLMQMYETGSPLEEDYKRLARLCGASPRKTKAVVNALLHLGKLIRVQNCLWNERVEKEIHGANGKQNDAQNGESLSEKRRAAAAKRWNKADNADNASADLHDAKTDFAYANGDANAMQTECKPNANDDANLARVTRVRSQISELHSYPSGIRETRAKDANPDFAENAKLMQKPDNSATLSGKPQDTAAETAQSELPAAAVYGALCAVNGVPAVAEKSQKNSQNRKFSDEFSEVFYPAYPHKVGKPAALKAFTAARRKADLSEIMAGLESYIRLKPADRAWCNPATWLNQERWNDRPAPVPQRANAPRLSAPPRRQGIVEVGMELMREMGIDDETLAREAADEQNRIERSDEADTGAFKLISAD